jgi:hypothetical protein
LGCQSFKVRGMSLSIISIQIIGLGGIITARPPLYA